VLVFLACGLLWTCGGSQPPPAVAPSSPPAEESEMRAMKKTAGEETASPASGEAAAPERESFTPAEEARKKEAAAAAPTSAALRQAQARAEWDRARAALDAAANDCALACRALASMERALVHLCALATSTEDQARCEEARRRLLDARDRVRRACGSCPGGPSVDRNAPIPSSR
jgi:hypothetical protein